MGNEFYTKMHESSSYHAVLNENIASQKSITPKYQPPLLHQSPRNFLHKKTTPIWGSFIRRNPPWITPEVSAKPAQADETGDVNANQ